MPQVVRTTNDLIVNSLYMIGELGVGEPADAFMLSTGLELINELLDKFSADSIYIPFLTTLDSNFIVGKDTYSISDMILGTDIVADRIVDLTFANYSVPSSGINQGSNPVSFNVTADSITNLFTLSGPTSLLPTGTPIVLSSFGAIPSPFVAGVTYYTMFFSPTTVMLCLSESNALMNVPIDILTNGLPINVLTVNQNSFTGTDTSLVYPLRIINKATYYNIVRQTNLQARPGFIFLNKQDTESLITVYPVPDQPYPFSLKVKVMINSLRSQDTLEGLPPYYYGFLKYSLARKFLSYYPSANWSQTSEDEYQEYYNNLKNSNETDLTIRPSVLLNCPEPFYWPNILSY